MKRSDHLLPQAVQAYIGARDTVVAFCKTQLRHPSSALVVAFAVLIDEQTQAIERVRRDAAAKLKTDKPEAAAAAGTRR